MVDLVGGEGVVDGKFVAGLGFGACGVVAQNRLKPGKLEIEDQRTLL